MWHILEILAQQNRIQFSVFKSKIENFLYLDWTDEILEEISLRVYGCIGCITSCWLYSARFLHLV